jgi:hypothetical protein
MSRALIIAAALVVAPVSYTVLLLWYSPTVLDFAWFALETLGKAQLVALLVISPIILATKLYEWAKRRGLI